MKKCLILIAVALMVAVPAYAGRTIYASAPTHPTMNVFQAYAGSSVGDTAFAGAAAAGDVIGAVPGVLSIIPGEKDKNNDGVIDPKTERWTNFISAPSFSIKSIELTKDTPSPAQCNWFYSGNHILQRGTDQIRLWWPLMYEAPGTKWTLTIFYTVPGQLVVFTEVWTWQVDVTIASVKKAIELFHELPFGLCEVPLVQDEALYPVLVKNLTDLDTAVTAQNWEAANSLLQDFEYTVIEACVTACPPSPVPTGPAGSIGIVNTKENPACCKLLVDAEALGNKYGIFTVKK